MPLSGFHPTIQEWFAQRLGEPTAPQREGWPLIRAGRHTLIAAPTGSGKTLAAFLWALDALIRQGPDLPDETHILYVSPLKALSNDVQKNLQAPLHELRNLNIFLPDVRVLVRTGDTPAKDRAAMARKPPHILVTTPESLYILLTSESGRRILRTVRTVIIDEVHALTRDKRGAHLALSLERLEALVAAHHSEPPTPVGGEERGRTACASHPALAGGVLSSPTPVGGEERGRTACASYPALASGVLSSPTPAAGDEGGRQSLSPTIPRPSGRGSDGAFQRIGLSATQKPIEDVARFLVGVGRECATVDVGHQRELDIAVEVPRSPLSAVCAHEVWGEIYERIAQLIQQHRTTLVFVNTRKLAERIAARLTDVLGEELVTCHHGSLSRTRRLDAERRLKEGRLRALVATASLELGIDIGDVDLAIQVGAPRSIATFLQRVGRAGHSVHRVPKGRLFPLTLDELVEAAALLRAVRRGVLDRTPQPRAPLDILAQQMVAACVAHTWDEAALYQTFKRAWPYRDLTREDFDAVARLHTEGRRGLLHHDGVGARLRARRRARITAVTCGGAIPDTADYQVLVQPEGTLVGTLNEDFAVESNVGDIFQLGNSSWRVLKVEPGIVRVADAKGAPPSLPFWLGEAPGRTRELSSEIGEVRELPDLASVVRETGTGEAAAQQLADYLSEGRRVLGSVPTHGRVILERFFDESGGMQLIVHALFGARINRAWGLALRKRFCRGFGFELQAAANEEAILISLGPQHSFPLADVFNFLHPDTARDLLIQALIDQPMFEARWRWNTSRALLIERMQGGKRVPAPLIRMRAQDLLVQAFPQAVACPETLPGGDLPVPMDHPLVRQTIEDCLHEAMDVDGFLDVLRGLRDGALERHARDTVEPSAFAHGVLSAHPYSFLDDAPLEERRAQAVMARRTLDDRTADELGALDPDAVHRVCDEAWPHPESADEVHEALLWMGYVTSEEARGWQPWIEELRAAGRVVNDGNCWFAVEAPRDPQAVLRGRLEAVGPVFDDDPRLGWHGLAQPGRGALLAELECGGGVLRTRLAGRQAWCERRLLARIHRYTLDRLRSEIAPVTAAEFLTFLTCWQHIDEEYKLEGPRGLAEIVRQLAGFEIPAAAWEASVLPARLRDFRREWLDELTLLGDVTWGRLWGGGATAIRITPIALIPREELDAWTELAGQPAAPRLSGAARDIHDVLLARGPLFAQELQRMANLLWGHLEMGLAELIAQGMLTCDSFAGLRQLITPPSKRSRQVRPAGRWSLFRTSGAFRLTPDESETSKRKSEMTEFIARRLLSRTGVVFRRTILKEKQPVPWYELVRSYRRMELRGEVRGGRFVAGFSGEQYALPEAVELLRKTRRRGARPSLELPAADPLNFQGILTPEPRIAPTTRARVRVG